ncbi:MAG: hypothetical protein JW724_06905 [Candidatus Altiarchaeota archaeon]|nr:hypothetical protein [Candidatus Altiarchaeota archaeon]
MDAKKIFKAAVFLTLFALMVPTINAQSTLGSAASELTPTNVILDYDLTRVDSNLKPGDAGILQIVVKNTGNQRAEKVQIYMPGTSNIPVNKRWDLGRIDALSTKTVSTTIRISNDAYVGLHTLQVRISFDGFDAEGDRDNDQVSVWDYPVRVYGNANFQASIKDERFSNGVTKKLVLEGTTKDGARDISATLSSGCASIVGSAKKYVGNLGKDESFNLEYSLQPSRLGVCPLTLVMDYSDASGNSMSETLTLGIDVQRSEVDFKILNVSSESLVPGTTAVVMVDLKNVGSAIANDVSVKLDLTTPFTAIVSSEKYVGDIKSDAEKRIEFELLVDAKADIQAYEIPLEIDYYDSVGAKKEVTKTIGVQVSGKPDIYVALDEAGFFTAGTGGKVVINVINKGFADVKFLHIKLLPTDQYDVNTINEIYIGNLDSDDSDNEEFEIKVKDDVPAGKIQLKVEVSYKEENSNIDHVESRTVDLSVLSREEYAQKMPGSNVVGILLSVVGGVIGLVVAILALWFIYKLLMLIIGFLDRKIFKRKV